MSRTGNNRSCDRKNSDGTRCMSRWNSHTKWPCHRHRPMTHGHTYGYPVQPGLPTRLPCKMAPKPFGQTVRRSNQAPGIEVSPPPRKCGSSRKRTGNQQRECCQSQQQAFVITHRKPPCVRILSPDYGRFTFWDYSKKTLFPTPQFWGVGNQGTRKFCGKFLRPHFLYASPQRHACPRYIEGKRLKRSPAQQAQDNGSPLPSVDEMTSHRHTTKRAM